jgi:hypothetical protein
MKRKKLGRPAAGDDGSKSSEYPTLTISMKPDTKARLESAREVCQVPAWRIVDEALTEYFNALPLKSRQAVHSLAILKLSQSKTRKAP